MSCWHEGAHECDEATYRAFVAWAATQTKLERHVVDVVEPPFEGFRDLAVPLPAGEVPHFVCGAQLASEWPSRGIVDPRPIDQRLTSWWRQDCKVRKDWWQRYVESAGGAK